MDYRRCYIRDLFQSAPGAQISAHGWVKTRRDSKGISFVQLNDGSCFRDLQVVINEGVIEEALLSLHSHSVHHGKRLRGRGSDVFREHVIGSVPGVQT